MNQSQTPDLSHSHLFLVRVWSEQGNKGQLEWHGRLQHVVSGEAHTFRGCPELIDVLLAMLPTRVEESRTDFVQMDVEASTLGEVQERFR